MFFKLAKALVYLYLRILFRIEVHGAENIPQTGAVVICSNHVNAHDPLVIATRVKRRVYFLGKKELYRNWFLRRLFLALGTYPVDRDRADMRAYKWALGVLKRGEILGLFSQGTRYAAKDDAAKNGVALFALKSRALVLPCGITGTYRLFSKITLNFGAPVSLEEHYDTKPGKELLEGITAGIMERVYELAEEA